MKTENELFNAIEKLEELKRIKFEKAKEIVEDIIEWKETDSNIIEHNLDILLDTVYDDESTKTFYKLCKYYSTIDKDASEDYIEMFKEQMQEDLNE